MIRANSLDRIPGVLAPNPSTTAPSIPVPDSSMFGNVASGPGATLNVYGTTSFQEAATNLAKGVATVHPEAAESLRWIGSHANADREPPDAQKHLNVVKAAAGWVWEGFIAIVNAGGSAIAPWLVSLIRNIGH